MLWMFIVEVLYYVTPALVGQVLESYYILLFHSWGCKPQCVVVVEAKDSSTVALTSLWITYEVFHTLQMLWMCRVWVLTMLPLHMLAKLFEVTWKSGYLLRCKPQCVVVVEAKDPSKMSLTSLWNTCDIIWSVSQHPYAVDVHMGSAATTSLPMPSLVNKSLTLKVTWGMVQAWVAKKLVSDPLRVFTMSIYCSGTPISREPRHLRSRSL